MCTRAHVLQLIIDELVKGVALGQNYRFVGQPVFEGEENPSQRAHLVCTIEVSQGLALLSTVMVCTKK